MKIGILTAFTGSDTYLKALLIQSLFDHYYAEGIHWKIYPNPMRNDGVFVAEDKPVEPYQGVIALTGENIYPATPSTKHKIPYQLPLDVAEKLIPLLNRQKVIAE